MDKGPKFSRKLKALTYPEWILGLGMIVIGALLAIWPAIAPRLILNCAGGVLIAVGIINVIRYLRMEKVDSLVSNDLAIGISMIGGGVLVVIFGATLAVSLSIICGLLLLLGGIIKLQMTLDFKNMNAKRWYIELALSILSIAAGVIVLINPFKAANLLTRIIGIALVAEAFSDMISKAIHVRKHRDFTIETVMYDSEEEKN